MINGSKRPPPEKPYCERNRDRFPDDFMFEQPKSELDDLRCQFGTSKGETKGLRYKPMAFNEQEIAMLSSALRSKRAIHVNIQIMRTFSQLRMMIVSHEDLKCKIAATEKKYDKQFRIVFEAITQLIEEDEKPKKKIGYIKEGQAKYGKGRTKKIKGGYHLPETESEGGRG